MSYILFLIFVFIMAMATAIFPKGSISYRTLGKGSALALVEGSGNIIKTPITALQTLIDDSFLGIIDWNIPSDII
jgi:hypothetical protein